MVLRKPEGHTESLKPMKEGISDRTVVIVAACIVLASLAAILMISDDGVSEHGDTKTHSVFLPEVQIGFSMESDALEIDDGGRCVVSYTLSEGYSDKNIRIKVNGIGVRADNLKRIYLNDIREDKHVTVSGIDSANPDLFSVTLPSVQIGYSLSSSNYLVEPGGSYTLHFTLHSGYSMSGGFGVYVNGSIINISSGTATISDVSSDQTVTVAGISETVVNNTPTPAVNYTYRVQAGDNTVLKVNGAVSSSAAAGDIITVEAATGYTLPNNYAESVSGPISVYGNGYTVSGNATFPSIYSATYMNHSGSVHERFCLVEGDPIPVPGKNPERSGYAFDGWQSNDNIAAIRENCEIEPMWIAEKYSVTFGKNIAYYIDDSFYITPTTTPFKLTAENKIKIIAKPGYYLPELYVLPSKAYLENGIYHIRGDVDFPSVFLIRYYYDLDEPLKSHDVCLVEGYIHNIINPITQSKSPFKFDYSGTTYSDDNFEGWYFKNTLYEGEVQIQENIDLIAKWSTS